MIIVKESDCSLLELQTSNNVQIYELGESSGWTIEEAEPLNLQIKEVEKDPDYNTPIWIQ